MPGAALDHRKKMLAKIHIAKKDLALDDATYRALLSRITGRSSATEMSFPELDQVIGEFKRLGWQDGKRQPRRAGTRPMAGTPLASKIRALWLDLYHLGELRDPSEEALAAFVEKSAGVAALQWLDADQADAAIKALQGWLTRVGYRRPDATRMRAINAHRRAARIPIEDAGFMFKVALIETQWRALVDLGQFRTGEFARLETWIVKRHGVAGASLLTPAQADAAIEELGRWVRRAKAKGDDAGR